MNKRREGEITVRAIIHTVRMQAAKFDISTAAGDTSGTGSLSRGTVRQWLLVLAIPVFVALLSGVAQSGFAQSAATEAGGAGTGKLVQAPACDPNWESVESPALPYWNGFYGVAAVSANDVWAVGHQPGATSSVVLTLIERWDGSSWSVVPSPSPDALTNYLYSVAAVSANDVWAVGFRSGPYNTPDPARTLTEHWDGSSWSEVASPNLGTRANYLNSVAAVSASDVWAVGEGDDNGTRVPLILHWNGSNWSVVPSPSVTGYAILRGVAAVSANDVWAVGYNRFNSVSFTFVIHWDGSSWARSSSPNPGNSRNELGSVSVVSANDVWTVGYDYDSPGNVYRTLTEHWDGSNWRVVPSPNPGAYNELNSVSVASANDVWAVGGLILHWDGTSWSQPPNTGDISLFSVLAISANDVWTVGENGGEATLWRYNPCPPSPTPTPTACTAGNFSDVPPGSPFHPFVSCLAGRSIISGYPDCTFRPGNNVTRGQLAKIVSSAAGFNESHSTQSFQDVAVSSTFYNFIERLASRSIISGYACGGVGELCVPPTNLPYFRPGAQVTRAQTAKIVSIAKGLPAPAPGQQTFQDVAVGSTFWAWIESLSSVGSIGGYQCGGPGEPCVQPNNQPYFRPGANVTRGQLSKIVSNTFFPNCQTP